MQQSLLTCPAGHPKFLKQKGCNYLLRVSPDRSISSGWLLHSPKTLRVNSGSILRIQGDSVFCANQRRNVSTLLNVPYCKSPMIGGGTLNSLESFSAFASDRPISQAHSVCFARRSPLRSSLPQSITLLPGSDLAGVSRLQYPPSIRIIRVMCSGMVHPNLVIEAFTSGADGVLVCGCHPGDCHYQKGNLKTERRAEAIRLMLADFGLEEERFRLEWVSAAEGPRFAQVVREFTEQVRKPGASPYKS